MHYERKDLRGDLLAGVTVTAYLIPQVMAYSTLAGLPPQTGLWVVVVTMTIYAIIGSSRLLSVGPESTTALLTAAVLAPLAVGDPVRYAQLAALLALLVGAFALLAYVFKLGFIGDLLSKPVLTGYMAGVAVIMITSQLGKITGVSIAGDTFVEVIRTFVTNVGQQGISWITLALGLAVAGVLLWLTPRFPRLPIPLFVMLAATAIVWAFNLTAQGIKTVGDIAFSAPHFALPGLNSTDLSIMLFPALGIFVVAYTDNILTARVFATRHQQRVHNNQEFLALGAANIGSSLISGFPVSSSASRTVIADASGAKSQLYSLVSATLVILSWLLFAKVISAFPAAALGGLVVYAAIRLIDIPEFRRLWRFRGREFLLAIGALVGVLAFDILYGVLAAVALSVIELLTRVARPHAAVLGQSPNVPGWHDIQDYAQSAQIPGLVVANAEHFSKECRAALDSAEPPVRWFLLNMEGNTEVDITGLDALEDVRATCVREDVVLALVRVKRELREELDRHGVGERIGGEHIFQTLPTAVAYYENWLTRHPA